MSVFSKSAIKSDLLLAEPFLTEPTFKRAVILLTEKNKSGSVGFILNKPVEEVKVSDLFKDFPKFDAPIFMGGPVNQENLYYIHSYPTILKDSLHIKEDIYVGGDFETLKTGIELGQISKDKIRFFIGYSGWSEYQLDEELAKKSWIVEHFNRDLIYSEKTYNSLWQNILKNKGGSFLEIANFPTDPSLN